MKKILFSILIGFVAHSGFSQSTLYVLSEKPTINNQPNNSCTIGEYDYEYNISYDIGQYQIMDTEVLISVDFKEGYNDDPSNNCNGPCGQFSWYCDGNDFLEETLDLFDTINIDYNGPDEIKCTAQNDAQTCLPIDYYAVLLPNLDPGDSERCPEKLFFEQHDDGQDHYVEGLKWQYFGMNGWEDLPNPTNKYPLNMTIVEALGGDWESLFQGNLKLRFLVTAPFTVDTLISSDEFVFSMIGCSPNLEDLVPIAETCPGANNGSFTMTLNRDLDEERLFVALYQQSENDQDNYELIYNEFTDVLIDNEDGTYSYTWPENLAPWNYKIKYQTRDLNQINEEEIENSWDDLNHSDPFTIEPATPVTYTLDVVDVNCLDGGDGQIIIEASGSSEGNYQFSMNGGQTWENFENDDNHTIMDLAAGNYTVEVQDGNGCVGTIDDNEVTVGQPEEAIQFSNITIQDATAFGFTNGSINVNVSGGTGGYTYEWTDGNNNTVDTGEEDQQVNGVYQIILEDIPADTYTLTVWDSKYNLANQNNNVGCTYFDSFVVDEPPQLQLSVQETIPISCNSANTFNNPSNDGQLTAIASGGVPPYEYFWKKKDGNQWVDIPSQNTAILSNLDAGEYAVNIEDAHGIVVGIYANNQLQQAQDVVYELEEPDLLEVELIKTNVNCFGGADGTATVSITGGTPPYEIFWATGESTETIENLSPANYWVQVTDARGCQAEGEINIEQPAEAVSLSDGSILEPLGFGFTNGSVTAYVTGGTPYPNNSYDYEWLDKDNNTINTTTAQPTQQGYQIVLEDIPSGTYTLVVKDANYNNAIQKEGCTYSRDYVVTEPPPLEVTILPAGISCNSANMFNNPTDDGQLTAIASGGVPFEPLIDGLYSYLYTWKRKDANGIWQVIPNNHTDLLDNVGEGEYAVNIEDANGIILGTYVNNVLQDAEYHVFLLEEPEQLILELDKTDVSCFGGNDGEATVSISGGIPPYEIFWSNNGASTQTANNLAAGTYWVYVMDALGCEVSAQVSIEEPEALTVQLIEQIDPTCNDIDNGSIALAISGGQLPYTYQWNTGEETTSLSGLFEGVYTFEVIDANGCVQFFEAELKSPLSNFDGLGADKVLCKNQIADFDVSIEDPNATYLWTSNFGFHSTSPAVSISEPGVYTATVTSALGCSESDSITIQTSNVEIDSQFLITSQAFAKEEVVLVNTSNPLGTSEEWIFPENAKIHEKDRSLAIISFDEPGVYEVILRSYQGECYQDYTKSIVVAEARELPDAGDAITPFIKEFMVYPNPSSGTFTVVVSLQEQSTASLRMFSLTNNYVYDERLLQGSANYETPYEMDLTSGVYLLLLETSKGNEIRKIVIL